MTNQALKRIHAKTQRQAENNLPQRTQRARRKSPLERSTTLVGRCVSLEIPYPIFDIQHMSLL